MLCCETCGAPRPDKVRRSEFLATTNPPEVFWQGRRLKISPMRSRMLILLLRFGRVSHLTLQALATRETTSSGSGIAVQIKTLRTEVPQRVTIVAIRGWGYELLIDGKRVAGQAPDYDGRWQYDRTQAAIEGASISLGEGRG